MVDFSSCCRKKKGLCHIFPVLNNSVLFKLDLWPEETTLRGSESRKFHKIARNKVLNENSEGRKKQMEAELKIRAKLSKMEHRKSI